MTKLDELRDQLNDIDEQLLEVVRKRQALVEEIGEVKRQMGRGTRDFGPSTELLSGSHVVFIDLGDEQALDAARSLFADTMASQVEMKLDQHDRAMAFVPGLSHALNIAFGRTQAPASPHPERAIDHRRRLRSANYAPLHPRLPVPSHLFEALNRTSTGR